MLQAPQHKMKIVIKTYLCFEAIKDWIFVISKNEYLRNWMLYNEVNYVIMLRINCTFLWYQYLI